MKYEQMLSFLSLILITLCFLCTKKTVHSGTIQALTPIEYATL